MLSRPQNTLYAYLVDADFTRISERVVQRIEEFIENRTWVCPRVCGVDRMRALEDGSPEWNLGLNLDLPNPQDEPPGWFSDVEALVGVAVQLRREFQCNVILEITDNRTGCAEDIMEIDCDLPDLNYLRRFIGTGHTSR